jgi:hypothetical protein
MQSFSEFLIAESKSSKKVQAVLRNYGYQKASNESGVTKYTHPRLDHTATVSDAGWTHSAKKKGGKTPTNLEKHLSKIHQASLFD